MRALPAALGIMSFALAALLLAGQSLRTLESASQGLEVTRGHVDAIPVTVFRPAGAAVADGRDRARPVVVIAHGFAGSQQLMQAFATTAARNGMIAVTCDFPGHGRHPQPLPGSLQQHEALLAALLGAVDRVVGFARTLPGVDGRVALLGHSMASDLVVRQAQADPSIVATVGVSLVYGGARMVAPNNLLSIYGSIEPAMVQSFGRRLVAGPDATDEAARSVVARENPQLEPGGLGTQQLEPRKRSHEARVVLGEGTRAIELRLGFVDVARRKTRVARDEQLRNARVRNAGALWLHEALEHVDAAEDERSPEHEHADPAARSCGAGGNAAATPRSAQRSVLLIARRAWIPDG